VVSTSYKYRTLDIAYINYRDGEFVITVITKWVVLSFWK
jgi:hypothetical protein